MDLSNCISFPGDGFISMEFATCISVFIIYLFLFVRSIASFFLFDTRFYSRVGADSILFIAISFTVIIIIFPFLFFSSCSQ